MLWRESYRPEVRRNLTTTSFLHESLPFIGSVSLEASREVEIWWRLFEEDFPGEVVEVVPESSRDAVFALRAPSRHPRIRFDSEAVQILGEIPRQRAFCAIVLNGIAELVVVGPPTEDVWEEVSTLWRAIRT